MVARRCAELKRQSYFLLAETNCAAAWSTASCFFSNFYLGMFENQQGCPQKAVWGHAFGAAEQAAGGNPAQTVARQRIQLILRYLETVQEK